jgi:hypothetical protein
MWERNVLINGILEKMEDAKLDCILCPAFPFAAIRVDDAAVLLCMFLQIICQFFSIILQCYLLSTVAIVYTMIWNLVDFPAGIVRFGTETGENIDSYDDEGDSMLKLAKEVKLFGNLGLQIFMLM